MPRKRGADDPSYDPTAGCSSKKARTSEDKQQSALFMTPTVAKHVAGGSAAKKGESAVLQVPSNLKRHSKTVVPETDESEDEDETLTRKALNFDDVTMTGGVSKHSVSIEKPKRAAPVKESSVPPEKTKSDATVEVSIETHETPETTDKSVGSFVIECMDNKHFVVIVYLLLSAFLFQKWTLALMSVHATGSLMAALVTYTLMTTDKCAHLKWIVIAFVLIAVGGVCAFMTPDKRLIIKEVEQNRLNAMTAEMCVKKHGSKYGL